MNSESNFIKKQAADTISGAYEYVNAGSRTNYDLKEDEEADLNFY